MTTMLCHDPRISNDRSDKRETNNPALMMIECALRAGFPPSEIDWERIAAEADHCDWPVDPTTGKGMHGG